MFRAQSLCTKVTSLLAVACCTQFVWSEERNAQTYTGRGVIYGLSAVLPEAWAVSDNSAATEGVPFKGEFIFDNEDQLISGQLESPGLVLFIRARDAETYTLIAGQGNSQTRIELSDVSLMPDGEFVIEAVASADTVSLPISFEFTEMVLTEQLNAPRTALGSVGPDVTASRVGLSSSINPFDDFAYYGTANTIRAFSMASTSCNIGETTAEWISGSSARHPLIAQNIFRYLDGRFEHIGQSWLKHSFCAVNEDTCGTCQDTSCGTLGLGCADTYGSGLNNGSGGGPKFQINPQGFGVIDGHAATHTHPYPTPSGPSAILGRLQIHDDDILAGGRFVAEIQYVTHDELPEDRHNNASWREVNVTLTGINTIGIPDGQGQESVHWQKPAIQAWEEFDPGTTVKSLDVPEEGRFLLGHKVTDNGDGTYHYEYAIQNLNSDRSAGSFSVPVPDNVAVSNVGFHDVDYHSGEPFDGTDWSGVLADSALTWATQAYDENENANALRWGTLYNFRFDATTEPVSGMATLGLFKPGAPDLVQITTLIPADPGPCPWDCGEVPDGQIETTDLLALLAQWGELGGCDFNGGGVGIDDLLTLLSNWGPCP